MGIPSNFEQEIDPILGWQDCKYIFPMTYPDTALIGIRTVEIATDNFTLETAVFSQQHERIAAVSRQIIVPYNYRERKKAPLSTAWVQGIKSLDDVRN